MKTNLLSNQLARAAFGITVCASIAMACSARDRADGTTARVSQVSQALSSAPLVWPTNWTPVKQNTGVLTDPTGDAQGSRDVVGTDAAPAAYISSDAERLFFRMRIGKTPLKTATTLEPFGWACELDTDADHTTYEFIANVNGIVQNDAVLFSQNTTQGTINSPSDKAEVTLQTYSALVDGVQGATIAHARVLSAGTNLGGTGGDFFIDWAVDVNDFPASFNPLTTPFRLVCGSSANAQNISSDPLSPSGATTLSTLDSDPIICSATGCTDACFADTDCASGLFCNTQAHICAAKLTNGTAIPTITGHTPALTGTCSTDVGTAVCVSAVCDTNDNLCGFANGDGTCTPANAATVCRSGVCSAGGVCAAAAACTVDSNCAATQFCDTAQTTCVPKLTNGTAIPTIAGHTPALTGACTPDVGTAVCGAGVCDVDNLCGFANGTGPCDAGNAATVCRSATCSATGAKCIPAGGCIVDADCGATEYCDNSVFACTAKLVNGASIPTIGGHDPALTGTCTPAAGTAVCAAGVCDADNLCGLANGTTGCTVDNGGTLCRSGVCSAGGACQAPAACTNDSMCAATQFCDTSSSTCVAKLTNGASLPVIAGHTPDLTGTCSAAVGTAVCTSGVCDNADDKCGFANGNGTCNNTTGATVCRSGSCGGDSVCGRQSGESCAATSECRVGTCTGSVCTTAGPDAGTPDSGAPDSGAPDSGTPDGGAPDSGTPDSGAPSDAGTQPGTDASAPGKDAGSSGGDASAPSTTPPDEDGVLEGGGISCAQSPRSAGGGDLAALCFGALGLASLRRRRRR